MPCPRPLLNLFAALIAFAPLSACAEEVPAREPLGLMGTIPIYWGESDGPGDILGGKGEAHWARTELEKDWDLRPVSYLSAEALAPLESLLLAQPRALSGEENVALDAWVRAGGHLLLFVDPLMTGHSRFAIGDRRRPQDVAMLSPILGHWGLRLELDEGVESGRSLTDASGIALPVDIPGRFALVEGEGSCALSTTAVLAHCRIGRGRATILADAAVLDMDPQDESSEALQALVSRAFGESGEIAGRGFPPRTHPDFDVHSNIARLELAEPGASL